MYRGKKDEENRENHHCHVFSGVPAGHRCLWSIKRIEKDIQYDEG